MTVTDSRGSIKRFWRTPWRFQKTFQTPLKKLDPFVAVIISALSPFEKACVTIDGYIFPPKQLRVLLSTHSLSAGLGHDCSLIAHGEAAAAELLRSTLADWVDFLFVPTPKPFVIYADHDEYITFLANTKSSLNRVAIPLEESGFEIILNYKRLP